MTGRKRLSLGLGLGALLLTTGLAGCSGCGDPSRDGFVCGVASTADGTYAERQRQLEAEAAAKEAEADRAAAERAAAEQAAAASAAEVAAAEARLAAVDREIEDYRRRLAQAQSRGNASPEELRQLEAKVAALEAQYAAVKAREAEQRATEAEIAQLEAENAALRRLLEDTIGGL